MDTLKLLPEVLLSLHTLLGRRTRGIVDAAVLAAMKPGAWLVNTSQRALVDETAVLGALRGDRLGGYAVDAFDVEPLPPGHPFRHERRVLATPHLGYVSEGLYRTFCGDVVCHVAEWLNTKP